MLKHDISHDLNIIYNNLPKPATLVYKITYKTKCVNLEQIKLSIKKYENNLILLEPRENIVDVNYSNVFTIRVSNNSNNIAVVLFPKGTPNIDNEFRLKQNEIVLLEEILSVFGKKKVKYVDLKLCWIHMFKNVLNILLSKCTLEKEYESISKNIIKQYKYKDKINIKICNDDSHVTISSSILSKYDVLDDFIELFKGTHEINSKSN